MATAGDDSLVGGDGADSLEGGDGNDTLYGLDGSDVLNGGAGNDTLYAGSGLWADVLTGGTGDDVYELYNVASQVLENVGEGTDTLRSYAWVTTLPANVENLLLVDATSNVDGIGNELNNTITGNAGSNILTGNGGNDTLYGLDGSDVLNGGAGNDTLYAGSGLWADVLTGGTGDDVYELYNVASQVLENVGEGTDTLRSYAWVTTLPANVENLLLVDATSNVDGIGNELNNTITGNAGSNILTGNGGNDTLYGLDGSDVLNGGAGNDTLYAGSGLWADVLTGGTGDDVYELYNVASQVLENVGEGTDTLRSYAWVTTLPANVENLLLVDATSNVDGIGNELNNTITGNAGSNILTGNGGNDTLYGLDGSDVLNGGAGNDTLYAGSGLWADVLTGGTGDDVYELYNVASQVLENVGEGTDTLRSYAWVTTLPANVENLLLADATSNVDGIGNELNNTITGNAGSNILTGNGGDDSLEGNGGNDTLYGLDGSDVLNGGAGNDTLYAGSGLWADVLTGGTGDDVYELYNVASQVLENVGEGTDTLRSYAWVTTLPANVENLLLVDATSNVDGIGNELNNTITGNAGSNILTGNGGNDTLYGLDGSDVLNGGAGNDTLYAGSGLWADVLTGGTGDDVYELYNVASQVLENVGEGTDTLRSYAWVTTLPANVENLLLADATSNVDGIGNELNNTITGNAGSNILTGNGGNDRLEGGNGHDSLSGGAGEDELYGGDGEDRLEGGDGDDLLAGGSNLDGGGAGTDTLIGGTGSDLYFANAQDVVVEEPGGGSLDRVRSDTTYSLGPNVEMLALLGWDSIDGTANELANILLGNLGSNVLRGLAGDDTLEGGSGAPDTLIGGTGNDVYINEFDALDLIVEGFDEGIDTLESFVSCTLAANVENLVLQFSGSPSINGTGNALDNSISGNAGNNILQGEDGSDSLYGGMGNDTLYAGSGLWTDVLTGGPGDDVYELYNVASPVNENADEGTDTLRSYAWVTTLPANVENLVLVDPSSHTDGIGNAVANTLTGNIGNNQLSGLDGADTLVGGGGADTLAGSAGADTFVLRPGDGGGALALADVITDYQDSADSIGLGNGLTYAGLTIQQGTGANANDTIIQRTATGEYLAVLQNVNSSVLDMLDFKTIPG